MGAGRKRTEIPLLHSYCVQQACPLPTPLLCHKHGRFARLSLSDMMGSAGPAAGEVRVSMLVITCSEPQFQTDDSVTPLLGTGTMPMDTRAVGLPLVKGAAL